MSPARPSALLLAVEDVEQALGRGHADPLVALASEELSALVGVVAQCPKDGACRSQQPVFAGRGGELGQARAEDEASLHVP